MKNLIALLVITCLVGIARAEDILGGPGIELPKGSEIAKLAPTSATLSVDYRSQYVLDGIVFSDEPVLWTDLFMTFPHGFYVDIWWSLGLDDSDPSSNFGDEADLTVGWIGQLESGITFNIGTSYFDLVSIGVFEKDILRSYFEISKEYKLNDDHAVTPFVKFEHMLGVDWAEFDGGIQINSGFRHCWRISEQWTIDQRFTLVYDSGVGGNRDGFLGEYGFALGYKLDEKITLKPIDFTVWTPISDLEDGRETEVIWGFGIQIKL